MRYLWLALRLLCLLFPICLAPGCQTLHSEHTLAVQVLDAETKKPITTAEVYLCERLKPDEVAPCYSSGFTQTDGIARLRTEPGGEHGFQVQAVAQGYLSETRDVAADVLKKIEALSASEAAKPRPPDVTVEIYSAPNFSVELVLPPGYRGLVKAVIEVQNNPSLAKGQRCFRFPVSASGDVLVKGPSLLGRVAAQQFRARLGDGPLLGTTMDAEKVGFRWVKGAGNTHVFVVGNQVDYEALHRQIAPEDTHPVGATDDAAWANRSHKYRYGKMTAKNYEPNN